MDELDKLKQAWQTSFSEKGKDIDQAEVLEIMKKRSSGPVGKLKRSLYIEIGASLAALVFLVYMLFRLPQSFFVVNTSILILLIAGMLLWYYNNLQKITKLWERGQTTILQSLESTLTLFRFFRKTYYLLNILFFPIGIYFGFTIGFGLGSDGQRIQSLIIFPDHSLFVSVAFWVILIGLVTVLFAWFLNFYVRKLYDNHIRKLEQILNELRENDM